MHKPNASLFTRIVAIAIDMSLVIFGSILTSFVIYRASLNSNPVLKENVDLQLKHIESSHLAKSKDNSYYSYETSEYFEKNEEGEYKILSALSYFYTVYLVNDTTKIPEGQKGSEDYDLTITVGNYTGLQKDYYTVQWFNTTILGLTVDGSAGEIDYFEYQKNGEENDYSKVGTVNKKYIFTQEVDGVSTSIVNMSDEMKNYVQSTYKDAVNTLYAQKFIAASTKIVENANSLINFLSQMLFVLIIFYLFPLIFKNGKSLGKLLFKLSIVNLKDDEPIKKWKVLLRGLLYLCVPVILYLVPMYYVRVGIVAVLLITSIIFMSLSKRKTAIHDLIAQTTVVEDINMKKVEEEIKDTMSEEETIDEVPEDAFEKVETKKE